MKKVFFVIAVLLFTIINNVSAQTLDEILANHFEVIGQEKLSEVQTFRINSKIIQGGMEIPLLILSKRPLKMRTEVTLQGLSQITAFDGEKGWTINPFMGINEAQPLDGEQIEEVKDQADIDGELFNYEAKGHKVELLGSEDYEGVEVYMIKVIKKNGNENIHYMDADNYVILKTKSKVVNQGVETEVETLMSNFKPVEGIIFPHSIEVKANGQTVMQNIFESVELNVELSDDLFEMPVKAEKENTGKE